MDSDNVNAYLKPFNFEYETQDKSVFYIVKNKRRELSDYDYKLKIIATDSLLKVELFSGLLNDDDTLKLLMIRINHYINNLTNKQAIVSVMQKGYRYNFVTNLVKYIEIY